MEITNEQIIYWYGLLQIRFNNLEEQFIRLEKKYQELLNEKEEEN